jgi:hypothetical protein
VTFSLGELYRLHYFVRVADSVIPPNHPSREHVPVMLERVECEISISRERNENSCGDGELEPDDRVGTAEAASIMAVTQRRVQQKIRSGELRAEKISRTYFLNRRDIA